MGGYGGETASVGEKVFWIVVYSFCSSSMLVINKLAVQSLPLPTVVSGAQLLVSAAVVVVMQVCGYKVMGPMDKSKVLPFMFYTAMFAGGLFANMKALMLTNVGAVIAARSCLPVIVCLIEFAFMGRALPSARSVLSLTGVVGKGKRREHNRRRGGGTFRNGRERRTHADETRDTKYVLVLGGMEAEPDPIGVSRVFSGARDENDCVLFVGFCLSTACVFQVSLFLHYTLCDVKLFFFFFFLTLVLAAVPFHPLPFGFAAMYIKFDTGVAVAGVQGFAWLFVWWILLALQMTYGKWMTEEIEMTQWERVFYTNAFAVPPTIILFFATGEQGKVSGLEMGDWAWFWLVASCAMGVGISYSGWRSRSVITATTFTLVGVLNKMATIAFTVIVWPHDTSALSIVSLVFCILFGLMYQDAPKRASHHGGSKGKAMA